MEVKKNKWIIITGILVILTMVMIFVFSAQKAGSSDGLSKEITRKLLKIYYYLTEKVPLLFENDGDNLGTSRFFEDMNHYVRKAAHMAEYAFLGMVFLMHIFAVRVKRLKKNMALDGLLALLFCSFYAMTDEFHQLFVEGRGAQLKDVFIDSFGAFWGIAAGALICTFLWRRVTIQR